MTPLVAHGRYDQERFFERVDNEARRLSAQVWRQSESDATNAAFQDAARRALRAPVLAERSVHLRRLAKRVLPSALRPTAKRLVVHFDKTSRALASRLAKRGSGL